jgi:asparagine synthase (glutamine-hydrolysing)
VTLGFNRLAIIDLSERGMQPMVSHSGRYRMVYNGEIYNYRELKQELAGYPFVSESDTEVILAAFEKWGTAALTKLNGIFGLALYDHQTGEIMLARDPVGVKPLYYSTQGGRLVFSSELPALLHAVPRKLNTEALAHYLRLLYVPAPITLVQGVVQLLPGTMLVYKDETTTVQSFTTLESSVAPQNYEDAVEAVRRSVTDAVERQLVSDRPVGLYLSGGIDSSVVLAVASKVHPAINTYSVGYTVSDEEDKKFNADVRLAKETAAHFGATHHEYRLTARDALALLSKAMQVMHSPVGNATALAQLYLAEQTKPTATVVLSGEGGDELFGGYERYRMAHIASFLGVRGIDRYQQLMFQNGDRLLVEPVRVDATRALFENYFDGGVVDGLMRADEEHWLVNEALARADAMGMGASVEVRVPLLDLDLRVLAHALPRSYKVTAFKTKRVLKDAFRPVLPPTLFQQPKRGWFSPGSKWLREPAFVSYIDELIADSEHLSSVLNLALLGELYADHRSKRRYEYTTVWAAVTLLAWLRAHKVTL